ncbi:HK97-gp10 family putative phage morphogenesis protein [Paraburkholderia sp. DGU8]|uniref:HK97-gp10 family putative phage morphogenesis protein n=1 Tax=Paraburkholderia sp. DGU8 TaxID=3161997 RepID=UPI003465722D
MATGNVISGLQAFNGAIATLKDDMQKKVAFSAALIGANVIKREAKAIALSKGLEQSGALLNNIAVKREANPPLGVAQYNLGVRHGRELGSNAKVVFSVRADGSIRKTYVDDPFYWWYLEFGTKPHAERGGSGRKLAFEADGSPVFALKVSNPGIQPMPFIGPAFERKGDEALQAMSDRVAQFIEKGKA